MATNQSAIIGQITPEDAEAWANNWMAQFIGLIAQAEQMSVFSDVNFTENVRRQGDNPTLIQGRQIDPATNQAVFVSWTSEQLAAVVESFGIPADLVELVRKGTRSDPSLLARAQAKTRMLGVVQGPR